MGNRAIKITKSLAWDELLAIFGGEENWSHRMAALKESHVEVDADIIELVDKYTDCWWPER